MERSRLLSIIAEHGRLKTNARILKDWAKEHLHRKQEALWRIQLRKHEFAAELIEQLAKQLEAA